jgi:hypothetical protein
MRLPVTAATLAAWLPDGAWLVPSQAALALAVAAFWTWLFTFRREFDSRPQPPSRVIAQPACQFDEAIRGGNP